MAGSVLARCWLHEARGLLGPVLLYDRVLPEFCLSCDSRVKLATAAQPAGPGRVERVKCCDRPQRVYRSEFAHRQGKQVIKPKLGLIVASASGAAGYSSTESLGQLWLCGSTGRYFIYAETCPGCGSAVSAGQHQDVHYGWVLLPLADAWTALQLGAVQSPTSAQRPEGSAIGPAELLFLEEIFSEVQPGANIRLNSPADVWAIARAWSDEEVRQFKVIAGRRGLELLYQCKENTQNPPPHGATEEREASDE